MSAPTEATDSHVSQHNAHLLGVPLSFRTLLKADGSYDVYLSVAGQGWKLAATDAMPELED